MVMREDIEKALMSQTQATAKQIAAKFGGDPVEVAKELNRMRADGRVEREKKQGGGNEYVWWLVNVNAEQSMRRVFVTDQPVGQHGEDHTPADPLYEPALSLSTLLRELASEPDLPTSSTVALSTESEPTSAVAEAPEFREVDGSIRILCELLGFDATATDTPIKDAIAVVASRVQASLQLKEYNERIQSANEKLRSNNAALERRIDELTIVDAEFVPHPLYVTVGRYSPPKRHASLEKAQRRANGLVRSEKETEVLVCEPVGRVVRGSEWRPT
jgi:hypothetical protein